MYINIFLKKKDKFPIYNSFNFGNSSFCCLLNDMYFINFKCWNVEIYDKRNIYDHFITFVFVCNSEMYVLLFRCWLFN